MNKLLCQRCIVQHYEIRLVVPSMQKKMKWQQLEPDLGNRFPLSPVLVYQRYIKNNMVLNTCPRQPIFDRSVNTISTGGECPPAPRIFRPCDGPDFVYWRKYHPKNIKHVYLRSGLLKINQKVHVFEKVKWYFVTKIVLTYCGKKLSQ